MPRMAARSSRTRGGRTSTRRQRCSTARAARSSSLRRRDERLGLPCRRVPAIEHSRLRRGPRSGGRAVRAAPCPELHIRGVARPARGRRARARAGGSVREGAPAGGLARAHRLRGRGGRAREGAARRPDDSRRHGLDGHEARSQGEEVAELVVAIIVDTGTRLVVQGLTGREGSFHGLRNRAYGTKVVAGVTPGKAGQDVAGIPVFDTVADAVRETGANTSMVFVPAPFAADAIYEAVDSGIATVICIAEGLPAHDMLRVYNYIRPKGITMIGA